MCINIIFLYKIWKSLPYKIFKISHIIFQLNKQNKVYLNVSLCYIVRKAALLVL